MRQVFIVDRIRFKNYALVECIHKTWKEGDEYPKSCRTCCEACDDNPERRIQVGDYDYPAGILRNSRQSKLNMIKLIKSVTKAIGAA